MTPEVQSAECRVQNFFDSPMKRARLVEAARGWLGTPFVAHAAIRGAGVDCIHLAAEIYRECGVLAGYQFPEYKIGEGGFLHSSKVLAWLNNHLELFVPKKGAPAAGDLICVRIKRVEHHVAVMITGQQFIHAWSRPAALENLKEWQRSVTGCYTPLQHPPKQ